jgi:hypothetical protein
MPRLSEQTTKALEGFLLVAAAFAVVSIGAVGLMAAVKLPKLIDHADLALSNIDRTVIIAGASLRKVDLAEEGQLTQLQASQRALTATLEELQKLIHDTNGSINDKLLPSATRAVGQLDDSIQDFRGRSGNLMEDAHNNLLELRKTQAELNQSIGSLDMPNLGANLNIVAANAAETSRHVNRISADAQIEADKFVAPKTTWQRIKGFAIVSAHVFAIVAVKVL